MKRFIAHALIAAIGAEGAAPEWMLLFAEGWGEVEGEGTFLVDREAYEAVAAYFARGGNDLVFDYEHQTMKGDKAPAAGWIKELRYADGRGIEARVEWTEEAAGYIARGEYRYFSPVFYTRKSDSRVAGVHSVALTNTPGTNNLTPILAKLGGLIDGGNDAMDFLKKLIAKLGLATDASEDGVVDAVVALMAKNTELTARAPEVREVVAKDVLAALELKDGDEVSTVVASIHALKQAPAGMVSRAEFDTLQAKLTARDADEAVAGAMAAGKITPDQKDWAAEYAKRDLAGFGVFVAKAPVVVPVAKLGEKREPADSVIADEAVQVVAKMFGNTTEDLKKFGGLN